MSHLKQLPCRHPGFSKGPAHGAARPQPPAPRPSLRAVPWGIFRRPPWGGGGVGDGKGVGGCPRISKPGFFAWSVTHPRQGARAAGAVRGGHRGTCLPHSSHAQRFQGPLTVKAHVHCGFQWFCGGQWFPCSGCFVGGQPLWGRGLLRAREFLSSCPRPFPRLLGSWGCTVPGGRGWLGVPLCAGGTEPLRKHSRVPSSLCGMMVCLGPQGPGPKGTPLCGGWGQGHSGEAGSVLYPRVEEEVTDSPGFQQERAPPSKEMLLRLTVFRCISLAPTHESLGTGLAGRWGRDPPVCRGRAEARR